MVLVHCIPKKPALLNVTGFVCHLRSFSSHFLTGYSCRLLAIDSRVDIRNVPWLRCRFKLPTTIDDNDTSQKAVRRVLRPPITFYSGIIN